MIDRIIVDCPICDTETSFVDPAALASLSEFVVRTCPKGHRFTYRHPNAIPLREKPIPLREKPEVDGVPLTPEEIDACVMSCPYDLPSPGMESWLRARRASGRS